MTTRTSRTDHDALSLLVSRFFRSLDERKFDDEWARAYFTDDVQTQSPIGAGDGRGALAGHTAEAIERYARTQHIATDVVSETAADGATATVSWNALMTHVHHDATLKDRGPDANPLFTVGGYYRGELRRTPDGWRFCRMAVEALWTQGEPPVLGPVQAE
ncbi:MULTISPECIES: nuclear transport factor 2 family protein [unclassified Streptomyces]|uniref:nuclear transport factor 2 family protein n=1 Tax=unclassified Streptomyces TaxID=2593676 RepID=UPI0036EE6291|nr:nuclear transport factor 2 family protein [Streptomyces sp. NBC_00827]